MKVNGGKQDRMHQQTTRRYRQDRRWWRFTLAQILVIGILGGGVYWAQLRWFTGRHDALRTRRTESHTRPNPASLSAVMERVNVDDVVGEDRPARLVDQLAQKANPEDDNWDTEVLAAAAGTQLKRLGKLIANEQPLEIANIAPLVADGFFCEQLWPTGLIRVFDDGMTSVYRSPEPRKTPSMVSVTDHSGAAGLLMALRQLVASLGDGAQKRTGLKVYRIIKSEQYFSTRVFYQATGRGSGPAVSQNATWLCRWSYPGESEDEKKAPRLLSIEVERYEQVLVRSRSGVLFTDGTESVMGEIASYQQQLLQSVDHWSVRISRLANMQIFGHHGLAVGDINGDGLEDIYVCDGGGLPNRMYVQNMDGTVMDVSVESGTDWLELTTSALLIDLDNDGDQDLVVAAWPKLLFADNDGRGRFELRSGLSVVDEPYSMCAADYDGDGDLDIYVCGYGAKTKPGEAGSGASGFEGGVPVPYHDANNGGSNVLLRNDGDFRFVDVTRQMGLDHNNSRWSFAAAWQDYDHDGDLDLYVSNDFGRNNLYRHEAGGFRDVAAEAGVEDIATGMSVAWGDYNRDGYADVYVSNMFSAAGNRVAYQRRFEQTGAGAVVAKVRRMARGNTLFANTGDGRFDDVSESAGVSMGLWAWGSKFVDLNNDGWLDLVVANGYLTAEDSGDL